MQKINAAIIAVMVIVAGVIVYLALANPTVETLSDTSQAPVTSGENPEPGSAVHDLPVEPAAALVRKDLAAKLGVDEKSIVIIRIEKKSWNDGCLGLGADELCTQALVEGFRIELLANGESYFYRSDTSGATIRQEPQ